MTRSDQPWHADCVPSDRSSDLICSVALSIPHGRGTSKERVVRSGLLEPVINSLTSSTRTGHQSIGPVRLAPISRRQQLRDELLSTIDALHQRRADLVPEGFIADYVALDWLEWNGGSLRITLSGTNMCQQMQAQLG